MKKLFLVLMTCIFSIGLFAEERSYVIKVTYSVTYEFRDSNGRVLSSQSGIDGTQIFQVCADNEGQARQKAIDQCSSTCSYGGQKIGSQEIGGVRCIKYEVRRIKKAEDISVSHPEC